MELPKEKGFYLWYVLDFGYFDVGCVQIMCDTPEHVEYLRSLPKEKRTGFYLYQTGFENSITMTMYHQAHDHLPSCDEDGKPLVDGWIPFDFRTVGLIKEPPIKLEPRRIPDATPEQVQALKDKFKK